MKFSSKLLSIAVVALVTVFVSGVDITLADEEAKVVNGVYVDGISIGGMTFEEAHNALEEYSKKRGEAKITIKCDDSVVETTMAQFGYVMKKNDFIEHGMNVGTSGNVIQRYKELKDVENGGLRFEAEFEFDESLVEAFIVDECTKKNVKAKEPQMVKKNKEYIKGTSCEGLFNYKEGETGRALDTEDALNKLMSKLENFDGSDIEVVANMNDTQPKYTIAQLKKCTTRLATYSTDFKKSSSARKTNIKNATSFINGVVIYPGEEFSTLKLITPFNSKNGYKKAGSYAGGKVVDTYGGGVCQVSTTLYNAIMRAELEISERSCHSMCIDYVPVSYDAAISESSGKDFKFVNNTNAPIYIEGYVSSDYQLHFSVYGEETRPSNREVKFKQVIVKVIEPGAPVITKDSSKYEDYKKVTQSAHTGYKAEIYKQIYVDGVMVEETLYNKSSYKSSPKYMIVGTKKRQEGSQEVEKPETSQKPDASNKPEVTQKPEAPNKPEVTQKPEVTNKPEVTQKPEATNKPEVTQKPETTKEPETSNNDVTSEEV